MTTTIPAVGDEITYTQLSNYHPNPPCRYAYYAGQPIPFADGATYVKRVNGCACPDGAHQYRTETRTSTVAEVIYWMDNSIELVLADGHREQVVAPHGDACF